MALNAMDKLRNKAGMEKPSDVPEKQETKATKEKREATNSKTSPTTAKKASAAKKKNTAVSKPQMKTNAVTNKEKPQAKNNGKHPGGRPPVRGEYKMFNIALPLDTYNKIKEKSGGNMTYYINDVQRKNVE